MLSGMAWTMFDSVSASAFPASGFDATAGYVAGSGYPSSAAILKRFPNLPHLTIATKGHDAQCGDFESGAMSVAQAPSWVDRQAARIGARVVVYCPASWTKSIRSALAGRSYILWSAHYTGVPHICGPGSCSYPQADGTQWINHGPRGENVDQSMLGEAFWRALTGAAPPVQPKVSIVGAGAPVALAAAALQAVS